MKTEIVVMDDGLRADNVVRRARKNISYVFLQKIFRAGKVKINSRSVDASCRVRRGDVIVVYADLPQIGKETSILDPKSDYGQKLFAQFKSMIIFENDDLIAINKPSGLAVQMGTRVPVCVETLARTYLAHGDNRCRLVHRIDKDTSGILLLAKNLPTAQTITRLFRENKVEKTYLAVVTGEISGSGIMDTPVNAMSAITCYHSLKYGHGYSLLELRPRTGRKHQLRIHCADVLLAPIYGDVKYSSAPKHTELLLHASRVCIEEPLLDISAPLPEYFTRFLANIG
ncbi:MAG: RluA family pseudouridine synthase [Holosporaceae bacterium]|jgi:23S rRNA pseudouridine955/2504/2580 synthase|nr:RluA family pseudouridine synthase [Holosporaceae bacterium]